MKANSAPAIKRPDARKIAIEVLPIDKLVPYKANARTHPPAQIAQIAASIKEFGFITPCVIDKNDVLIAGHGRVLGAKSLGLKTVPAIRAEHLTEAQVKAFRLADNKIALNADWFSDLLRDEFHILQGLDFDLSLTGFSDAEVAATFSGEGAADIASEWTGMPEFTQNDQSAFRTLIVHFASQSGVDDFSEKIGQTFGTGVRSIWHPEAEIRTYADKKYDAES